MKQLRFSRAKSWNDRGAIEGLPLQLMIMVIVAGVALAIILGWVLSIQTPSVIGSVRWTVQYSDGSTKQTVDIPSGQDFATVTITVSAYDQRGNPIPGIAVTLNGAGVSQVTRIDGTDDATADGSVVFRDQRVTLPSGSGPATIGIEVRKSGYPPSTNQTILVRHL